MYISIRKIGNSRGVIIPSTIIEQLDIKNSVELTIQDGALILKPVPTPREGWFACYRPELDDEPMAQMRDLDSEQEDWDW